MQQSSELDLKLRTLAANLDNPAVARRLQRRWSHHPTLGGLSPAEVLASVTTHRGADHREVFAALVRLGQNGDEAATELVLLALRPALWQLHRARYHDDAALIDDLYTDATMCLRTIDPGLPLLYERILGRTRAFRSRQVRYARRRADTELTIPDPDRNTSHDPVGEAATANVVLERLDGLAHQGSICPATWRALVMTRGLGRPFADIDDPRSADHLRSDTSRLARRLEHHAAA